MLASRLKDVPVFAGLSKKELELVGQQTDEIDVPAGRVLARQGQFGHEFFVVQDGTAEVTRDGERVAELGPGDFFGEVALLQEERRTATVTATSPMSLIVMTAAGFRSIHGAMPEVHARVTAEIQRRTAQTAAH